MGANMPDIRALRDVEWYNLRRSCIKKYTDLQVNVGPCVNLRFLFPQRAILNFTPRGKVSPFVHPKGEHFPV
jgi:hypothetical protein